MHCGPKPAASAFTQSHQRLSNQKWNALSLEVPSILLEEENDRGCRRGKRTRASTVKRFAKCLKPVACHSLCAFVPLRLKKRILSFLHRQRFKLPRPYLSFLFSQRHQSPLHSKLPRQSQNNKECRAVSLRPQILPCVAREKETRKKKRDRQTGRWPQA